MEELQASLSIKKNELERKNTLANLKLVRVGRRGGGREGRKGGIGGREGGKISRVGGGMEQCIASFPGLLTPAFVACGTNVGEGLVIPVTCCNIRGRWVDGPEWHIPS